VLHDLTFHSVSSSAKADDPVIAERGLDADHIVRLVITGCPPTQA